MDEDMAMWKEGVHVITGKKQFLVGLVDQLFQPPQKEVKMVENPG